MVLDVDGNVVSVEALVSRVEHLIEAVGHGDWDSDERSTRRRRSPMVIVSAERQLEAMRFSQAGIQAPVLDAPRGARAHLARAVKRAVRKLTRWYVEPRWENQLRFDRHAIDLSSALLAQIRQVESELRILQERNAALEFALLTRSEDGVDPMPTGSHDEVGSPAPPGVVDA